MLISALPIPSILPHFYRLFHYMNQPISWPLKINFFPVLGLQLKFYSPVSFSTVNAIALTQLCFSTTLRLFHHKVSMKYLKEQVNAPDERHTLIAHLFSFDFIHISINIREDTAKALQKLTSR